MRILVSRYGALGDTVFITSIIEPLLQQFPQAQLDLLISERVKALFRYDQRLNKIITLRSYGAPLLINKDKACLIGRTLIKPYDLFINLDTSKKSMRLARMIKAKKKYGPPYQAIEPLTATHAVAILRNFYKHFLNESALQLAYPSLQSADFTSIKKKFSLTDNYIILNTTNSLTARPQHKNFRAWPTEYWQQLLAQLATDYPQQQLVLISSAEQAEIDYVKSLGPFSAQVKLLLGETSLPELISLIAHANALICTDTGPLHIAAAVNTPIITLFGPSDWRNTGPFIAPNNKQVNVLTSNRACSPCDKSERLAQCSKNLCMYDLTPALVCRKLSELLSYA